MMRDDQYRTSERNNAETAAPAGAVSLADFDEAEYRAHLDGLELDEDQAHELLRIVWDVMRMCVEMNVPTESWGQIIDAIINGSADESGDVD